MDRNPRTTFRQLWARADTLAFLLFIPIINHIKDGEQVWDRDLDNACSAACIALDMRETFTEHNLFYI